MMRNCKWTALIAAILLLLVAGCGAQQPAVDENANGLSASFDPENAKEYGLKGIYLGQGIAEAIEVLKPTKYDFMDTESRQSLSVEQLAKGQGTLSMGIILVDNAQLMMKVQSGVVQSLIMGGVPADAGERFATNRGFPLYGSVEELQKLYGKPAAQGTEWIYKGSKYQAAFSVHEGKVIGYRFDLLQ